jgi:hypothetical protein
MSPHQTALCVKAILNSHASVRVEPQCHDNALLRILPSRDLTHFTRSMVANGMVLEQPSLFLFTYRSLVVSLRFYNNGSLHSMVPLAQF